MTKMTYVNAIDAVLNGEVNDEVRERLVALRESLAKRNARKSDKLTKTQRENEGVKSAILEVLSDGEAHQCKDIAAALEISGQKCSALLRQMVEGGSVEKFIEKRVTYFKAA